MNNDDDQDIDLIMRDQQIIQKGSTPTAEKFAGLKSVDLFLIPNE